ncbi:MAG: DUF488 domain-containing protein [Archaeoglobaceae archaeon]
MEKKVTVSICGPDLISAYEKQILEEIYENYRKKERIVYTTGYEGKSLEDLINILTEKGVKFLLDVREQPRSRRKEFSRDNIKETLKKAGIEYVSFKKLGTPREIRKKLKENSISFEKFAEEYRNHLANNENYLLLLKILASEKTSVIMCYEADWKKCHRAILTEALEKDGFKVVHL